MGVRSYLLLARDCWILLLVGITLGLGVAGAVTLLQPRTYASDFTMILTSSGSGDTSAAYDGSLLATDKAKSYSQLLGSDQLAGEVVSELNLPVTPADLAGRITATLRPDTALITTRVTDTSPAGAQQIATVLAERFAALVSDLEKPAAAGAAPVLAALVAERPSFSDVPVSPQPALAFALGGLLGLLVPLALVIGMELRRRPVRSYDDVRDVGPLLGSTTDGPTGRAARTDADPFQQIRAHLALGRPSRPGPVLAIVSPTPGDGRTAVATSLATAVGRTGRRVALVDTDVPEGYGPSVAFRTGRAGGPDVPVSVAWWARTNGGPPPLLPNGADVLGTESFRTALERLRAESDLVVVDTPPVLCAGAALDVMPLCDGVVLVACRGRTRQEDVRAAARSVAAVGGRIRGIVLSEPGTLRRRTPRAGNPPALPSVAYPVPDARPSGVAGAGAPNGSGPAATNGALVTSPPAAAEPAADAPAPDPSSRPSPRPREE